MQPLFKFSGSHPRAQPPHRVLDVLASDSNKIQIRIESTTNTGGTECSRTKVNETSQMSLQGGTSGLRPNMLATTVPRTIITAMQGHRAFRNRFAVYTSAVHPHARLKTAVPLIIMHSNKVPLIIMQGPFSFTLLPVSAPV